MENKDADQEKITVDKITGTSRRGYRYKYILGAKIGTPKNMKKEYATGIPRITSNPSAGNILPDEGLIREKNFPKKGNVNHAKITEIIKHPKNFKISFRFCVILVID